MPRHRVFQCDNDGEIEYEFPCYNYVETLDGLWDPPPPPPAAPELCYGGLRLRTPPGTECLMGSFFTRIQVMLTGSRVSHGLLLHTHIGNVNREPSVS